MKNSPKSLCTRRNKRQYSPFGSLVQIVHEICDEDDDDDHDEDDDKDGEYLEDTYILVLAPTRNRTRNEKKVIKNPGG